MKKRNLIAILTTLLITIFSTYAAAEYCEYDNIKYWIVDNNSLRVYRFLNTEFKGELVIPDSVWVESLGKSLPVKETALMMLAGCSVSSIVLPSTLTANNSNSFCDCEHLTNIDFSKTKLKMLMPLTNKPSNIATVSLPEKLEIINAKAFMHTQIQDITIPDSVWFIVYQAFNGTPLKNISFGKKVMEISEEMFCDCVNLKNIDIPQNITTFNSWGFKNTNISDITIHESVEYLYQHCFSGMNALRNVKCFLKDPREVTCYDNPEDCSIPVIFKEEIEIFDGTDLSDCTLWVPEESLELYRSLPNWQGFKKILPLTEAGMPEVTAPETETSTEIFDLTGRPVTTPRPGQIYIEGGQKKIAIP